MKQHFIVKNVTLEVVSQKQLQISKIRSVSCRSHNNVMKLKSFCPPETKMFSIIEI